MTFLATVATLGCVLLAADRGTYRISGDDSHFSDEEVQKLVATPSGFVTASGADELITPVKARFSEEEPKSVDEYLHIIEREQNAFRARHGQSALAERWIERSTWKLSLEMGKTVVAALYDSKEHSLRGINPGLAILTCPSSVSSTRRESEQRALSRAASRFAHTPPDEKGIEYLVGEIAKIVGSLKTDGHGVSRLIDVAVHAPGSMRQFCVEARVA